MRESLQHRRDRSNTLARFFLAGAVLSLVAMALPGWEEANRPGLLATVILAASAAAVLLRFGERVDALRCHALLASGTGLIAACQVLAGEGSPAATYALLYVWVALHAALFFGHRAVAGHLLLSTVAHASAVMWLGEHSSLAPQLAVTLGTQLAACVIVGSLATELRRLAATDVLTGAANRRSLDESAAGTFAEGGTAGPVSVAILDLDGFKELNDDMGHAAGDRILTEAVASWQSLLRPGDVLARTGGDEFTVLLTDCEIDSAEGIITRLVEQTPSAVSCSAGLAQWDGHESRDQLATRTDRALYAAKASGFGLVVRAPQSLRDDNVQRG